MDGDFELPPDEQSSGTTQPAADFPETLDANAFAQQSKGPDFPDTIDPEAFDASPSTTSRSGSIARGVEQGVVPGIGGLAGAVAGAEGGAALGAAAGPVGSAVGGFVGGVGGALGAGWLLQKGQDWVLDKLGLGDSIGLSKQQRESDEAQHPYLSMAGKIAPTVPLLTTTGGAAARLFGAAVGGGIEAGSEYAQEGHVDPIKAAMAAATGAVFPNIRGRGGFTPAEDVQPRTPGVDFEGKPGGPKGPLDGEVLPPDQQNLAYRNDGKFAEQINEATRQRNSFPQNDPGWKFWNDHVVELQSRQDGKGGVDVDASLGPNSDENPFTYQHADRANDVTTVARGVATENPPAPQIKEAGNPVGAPMEGRIAQRPSDPLRDYRKLPSPKPPDADTAGSTKLSTAPIKEDIAAALQAREQPQVPPDQAPAPAQLNGRRPLPDLQGEHEADTNRAMRQGEQAFNEKQAQASGDQKGEAFEPGVTDAVTLSPGEQRVVDAGLKALREAGMTRVIERLNQIQDPMVRAQKIADLHKAMASESGEAVGNAGELRMPAQRPQVEGLKVQARDKADAARKEAFVKSAEEAVAKYGPPAEGAARGDLATHATQLLQHVLDATKGHKWYNPNTRTPEMQLVQAARKLVSKPTKANAEAYQQAAALYRGENAEQRVKSLDQETAVIEGDIKKKPALSDAAAEAQLSKEAPDTATDRPEYTHFRNEKGDESAVYTRQHNDLTHWLNNLSDESHAALAKMHPDLETNLKATQDPKELHDNLLDDLADWQRKNIPAEFDAVPGENAPVVKRTKVTTRDQLEQTEPGAPASPGRSLKGTPEFEKLAAQYAKENGAAKPKYDLDHEIAARKEQADMAVDGSDRAASNLLKDFLRSESGNVPLDRLLKQGHDWLANSAVGQFFHPRATQPVLDYGDQIGMRGVKLRTDITRAKAEALANARLAAEDKLTPIEKGRIYRAAERGEVDQLPVALKDHFNKFWKPMLDKAGQAYDDLRDVSIQNKFPGWETMPERKTGGQGFMEWMPRRAIHDLDDDYNPITNGSSLSNWATSAQERDWFVAHDTGTGDRFVYRVNPDGKMVFYNNHQASRAKTPPGSFDPRDIGSQFMAGNKRMQVDHATVDELMAHGNGENGKPLQYSDNPGYVISDGYIGLKAALYRAKLLDHILTDPQFKGLSTFTEKKAKELWGAGNYAQTVLPQLRDRYFPKPVAWAFDDLVKTGFNYNGSRLAEGASRVAQATLKPFYFLGPEVHVFNEMDKYIIGNGLNHLNVPREAKSFAEAIKSVRAQDGIQAEIMDAGGNPMFLHSLTSQTMPQIAKLLGEDLARRQWKYDPLMKVFGVNAKELSSELMRASNKFMWWQSDVLYTSTYLQFKKQGLSPAEAVKQTEHIIDSYNVPTTFGSSVGLRGTDAGRGLQKLLTDPITALFGRFHYGLYSFVAQMAKNMSGANGTKGMLNGAVQAALMLGMYQYGYPMLSKAWGQVTGNEHSEFERRGATRLVGTIADTFTGKKHADTPLRNLWTPSTLVSGVTEQLFNRDWTGKAIEDQPYNTAKGAASNIARRGERAVQTAISPYGAFARSLEQPGATPSTVARGFFESNFGLKTPSPGSTKYEQQQPKRDNALLKAHRRRPSGLIERGAQWLTE